MVSKHRNMHILGLLQVLHLWCLLSRLGARKGSSTVVAWVELRRVRLPDCCSVQTLRIAVRYTCAASRLVIGRPASWAS